MTSYERGRILLAMRWLSDEDASGWERGMEILQDLVRADSRRRATESSASASAEPPSASDSG